MFRKHRPITLLILLALWDVQFLVTQEPTTGIQPTLSTTTTTTTATTPVTTTTGETTTPSSSASSTSVSKDAASILPKKMDKLEIALVAVNFIPNKDKDGKKRIQFWVFYSNDGTNKPKVKNLLTKDLKSGFEVDFPVYAFSTILYEASNKEYDTVWNDAKSNNLDWKNIEDLDKAKNYPIVLERESAVSSYFLNDTGSDLTNQTLIVEFNDNNIGITKGYTLKIKGINITENDNGKGTPTNNGLYIVETNMSESTVNEANKTGFFQMPDNDSNRSVAKEIYKKHAKPYYKRAWFIILAILLAILIIVMFSGIIGAICSCFKDTGNNMTEKFVA